MNSLKRMRTLSTRKELTDDEQAVYKAIQNRGNMGVEKPELRRELKTMRDRPFNNSIKSLLGKNKIKEVKSVQNKKKSYLMGAEFSPSVDVTGGAWYSDGELDSAFIEGLQKFSLKIIRGQKVTTVEKIYEAVTNSRAFNEKISVGQIKGILKTLVLDKEILEVKSSGLEEFSSIPVGTVCYCYRSTRKVQSDASVSATTMVSIPCGACPRINQCTPDGAISPLTCQYYNEWLNF